MSAAVALPQHQLHESPNTRGITINSWHITSSTNPISNASQLDELQSALGIPLPEMTFGSNYLELEHKPTRFKYRFSTPDLLSGVRNGELQEGDGGVKVGYADAWLKSRTGPDSSLPMPETVPTKPYDWTYTTTHPGTAIPAENSSFGWQPADPENQAHTIPMAELRRPDPIMFYSEIPLFEDELHDNGSSSLLVRIRVMPTCIFVLGRFTLRVDGVLFRTYDTRLYHSFESNPPLLVRESSGWEAAYDRVKKSLPSGDDLSPLTDPLFIANTLAQMPSSYAQKEGAGTRWRGLGTRVEIAELKA